MIEEKTPLEEEAEAAALLADPNHITPMDGKGHIVAEEIPPNPKYVRSPKPSEKSGAVPGAQDALADAKVRPGYGEGPDGFKRPKTPSDKLR